MRSLFIGIIVSMSQLVLISSLLIETGKKQSYCFYKRVDSSDELHASFVVSGENEEKVNAILYKPNGGVLFESHNSDGHDQKFQIEEVGDYKFCFFPHGTNSYYISFEFFTLYEKGHTLNLAKDENIHDMKKDVTQMSLMFEEMEKNIKFIMDRRNKHTMVMNEIGSAIKHISYFKMVVIILVSLLQIFLISKFMGGSSKKSSVGYSTNGLFEMTGAPSI